MERIQCGTVWGGIRSDDLDVCTAAITASLYSSASEGGKGGDIYYFSVCGADILTRVALADVVGHGQGVSDISQWLYDGLVEYMHNLDGNCILSQLNHRAVEREFDALTTAATAAIYRAESRLFFSYAGHPPALIRSANDGGWRELTSEKFRRRGPINLPLGVEDDTEYEQDDLPLQPGDMLLFYTDGVIEAPSPQREFFGLSRLMSVVNECGATTPHDVKQAVIAAVRAHTQGDMSHDDVTLMAIEVNG